MTFTPKKTARQEAWIRERILGVLDEVFPALTTPIIGPLAVRMIFNLERPKSTKRLFPEVRPDLDNLVKLVKDAASKADLWGDDSQVCAMIVEKRYASPRGLLFQVYRREDWFLPGPRGALGVDLDLRDAVGTREIRLSMGFRLPVEVIVRCPHCKSRDEYPATGGVAECTSCRLGIAVPTETT